MAFEERKLFPECLQQTNIGDDGNLGWYLRFGNDDCQG